MADRFILLDGAMGTGLQKRGLKTGQLPEEMNLENPEIVEEVHREYIAAGAEILYSNTFGANRKKLARKGLHPRDVIPVALKIARKAAGDKKVALDLGPIGEMTAPMGTLSFEEAYDLFAEQIVVGRDLADLIVIETMADLAEVKAAILAAKERSDLPIFVTMTFEEDGRTFSGTDPRSFAALAEGLGVDALGVNCSLGPKEILPIIKEIRDVSETDLIVKANAGLPDGKGNYVLGSEEFSLRMEEIADAGVKYLGGCCGTDPEYISRLKSRLEGKEFPKIHRHRVYAAASPTVFLPMDRFRVVGERINPTGKKKLARSLKDGSMEEVLALAVAQKQEGAEILDVNMGIPNTDERALMEEAVTLLTGIPDLPLQLDSAKAGVLEKGLRKYPGIPVVNSVNGGEKSLDGILPSVKKYGAFVIGLTLDEEGIPMTPEGRLEIGKRIVDTCLELGIPKEKIILDPLALTVSSSPESPKIALETLARIKRELGVKTALGVSNISFGLPERERVTAAFLQQALATGLDLPIVNPGDDRVREVLATHRLLFGMDKNGEEYIKTYGNREREKNISEEEDFPGAYEAMARGQKDALVQYVRSRLKELSPMDIIEEELIPALDQVGEDYEEEKIYLPQLITAASTAQKAFSLLRDVLEEEAEGPQGGKILLATVKGDVHDIGKNIVKVILQNYGYRIFDLGKDVAPELIVKTAKDEDITLIGLSALMTTTVESMEETVKMLREEIPRVKIMVGGAVLTEEIAEELGADYYVADAKEDIVVAKAVFGGEDREK